MTNVLAKQAQFMGLNFLRVGDVLNVLVLPILGEKTQVRSKGGILGILTSEKPLLQGTNLDAKVVGFEDDVPIFSPTEEWLFTNQPQKARVIQIFPRAIGSETDNGKLVYYECDKLPDALRDLSVGDTVIVDNLIREVRNGGEMYKASRLELVPKESKFIPTSKLEAWSHEQVEAAYASGQSKTWQGVDLGKKYWVEVHNTTSASIKGVPISLEEGQCFPKGCKRAEVLITYISGNKVGFNKEIKAKFVRKEQVSNEAPKAFSPRFDDPTSVGHWNKDLADKARSQGSKWLAGPYQLGRNYKVEINNDGKPEFSTSREKTMYPVNSLRISKISSECDFEAFDNVSCRIDFIYKEGNGNYVFEVTILKVL